MFFSRTPLMAKRGSFLYAKIPKQYVSFNINLYEGLTRFFFLINWGYSEGFLFGVSLL